jgi:hypothetical protein
MRQSLSRGANLLNFIVNMYSIALFERIIQVET